MTQDEIIEMARQAGMYQDLNVSWNQSIQNFAKLVAAKEREACAKLVEVSDELEDWEIICGSDGRELLNAMANAIRARGNT
jgi:hypothetical protein